MSGRLRNDPSGRRTTPVAAGKVTAQITSLDTGKTYVFRLAPNDQEREVGADWGDAGVAQASPQFIEYQSSRQERRTLKACVDAYMPNGDVGTIEPDWEDLKYFTRRVPGLHRAHICLFTNGSQRFKCVVEEVRFPIHRFNRFGSAMQALEAIIVLREIP